MPIVWSVLVSASLCALMITGATWWERQHRQRLATVDLQSVLEAKQSRFAERITRPGATDSDREAALAETSELGSQLAAALHALQGDCACILLARAAVVGVYPEVADMTPALLARLGMTEAEAKAARARLDARLHGKPEASQ